MKKLRVRVTVDRPIGYVDEFNNTYPINYGYIEGIIGGDNEEQDAYIISRSVNKPVTNFEGELIAIIHRKDDIEDKWVITSKGESYTEKQIKDKVDFKEKYFDSEIKLIKGKHSKKQ